MQQKSISIKTVQLHNNCPECYYNKGLNIEFKQIIKETKFYKTLTNHVDSTLYCSACNTTIYPAQWTDDIEKVYAYQLKVLQFKPTYITLTKLAWVAILLCVILIIAVVIAFINSF